MTAVVIPAARMSKRLVAEIALLASIAQRGAVTLFYPGEPNHCPRCHGTAWHVGRITAECARCGTPLPLFHPTERN